jgi:hypothetical protein
MSFQRLFSFFNSQVGMLFSLQGTALKEDALVDALNIFAVILPLGLFCLLVIWLAIFAWLALRPTSDQRVEDEEQETSLPVPQSSMSLPLPIHSSSRHSMTQKQPRVTVTTEARRNMALEHSGHY